MTNIWPEFESEIQAFEKSPTPQGANVFYGSSSIRLWENLAQCFPGVSVLKEQIDHDGLTLRFRVAAFARGSAGNHGGTGIDGQKLAHALDIHHAAVRNDVRIDRAMAVMQAHARRADAPSGVVIPLGSPIGGHAGQSATWNGLAVV